MNRSVEVEKDFKLLEEVLFLLKIKDTHNLSKSCMEELLNCRVTFTTQVPEEWPRNFDDLVKLLKRTGYVDPKTNTYRICAGKDHCTIFYPQG